MLPSPLPLLNLEKHSPSSRRWTLYGSRRRLPLRWLQSEKGRRFAMLSLEATLVATRVEDVWPEPQMSSSGEP